MLKKTLECDTHKRYQKTENIHSMKEKNFIWDWLIFDGFYWTSVTVPAHTQEEAGPNYRHKNAIWKQIIQSKKVKWSFHVFLGR